MNPTLRERLIRAEQHFLLAVASNDEESLKVFSQQWFQLARDIENTKATGRLDDNTAHFLSKVSQAIENTIVCILESGSILQESLGCSISDFIQDIPSDDPPITSPHSQTIAPYLLFYNISSSMNSTILGQQKLLDSYAYRWLRQNMHDPYPNSMQMQIISDVSGTSTAQVELWFQEARDSIGWNKLSRNFFAGSVDATVAAAQRVYLEHDKNISFDIVFAFTAAKTSAETLFSECPPLQGKNVDTDSVGTIAHHRMGYSLGEYINGTDSTLVPQQVDYLAPLDPLSDLSDSDESEVEDTTPPPSIAGCKRVLTEDEFTYQAADLGRPQKRPRCVVIFSLGSFRLKWACAAGNGLLTGPLPGQSVLPLYPQHLGSRLSKLLICRRRRFCPFRLCTRRLQHRQGLYLDHRPQSHIPMSPSRYTDSANEGFHNVFHRHPPNGNAPSLSPLSDTLGRTLRCHAMSPEVDLQIRVNSYSPRCRCPLTVIFR